MSGTSPASAFSLLAFTGAEDAIEDSHAGSDATGHLLGRTAAGWPPSWPGVRLGRHGTGREHDPARPSLPVRSIDAAIFDLGGVVMRNGGPGDFQRRFPDQDPAVPAPDPHGPVPRGHGPSLAPPRTGRDHPRGGARGQPRRPRGRGRGRAVPAGAAARLRTERRHARPRPATCGRAGLRTGLLTNNARELRGALVGSVAVRRALRRHRRQQRRSGCASRTRPSTGWPCDRLGATAAPHRVPGRHRQQRGRGRAGRPAGGAGGAGRAGGDRDRRGSWPACPDDGTAGASGRSWRGRRRDAVDGSARRPGARHRPPAGWRRS